MLPCCSDLTQAKPSNIKPVQREHARRYRKDEKKRHSSVKTWVFFLCFDFWCFMSVLLLSGPVLAKADATCGAVTALVHHGECELCCHLALERFYCTVVFVHQCIAYAKCIQLRGSQHLVAGFAIHEALALKQARCQWVSRVAAMNRGSMSVRNWEETAARSLDQMWAIFKDIIGPHMMLHDISWYCVITWYCMRLHVTCSILLECR